MISAMAQSNAPTVLITGASSGIGFELAKLFARDGYRLYLTARAGRLLAAVDQLRPLATAGIEAIAEDLADPAAPQRIVQALNGVCPDVLINNAGFGTHGTFADSDETEQLQMLQVNITALTHLTHLLLAGMTERRTGRIMNVASTAAFQPGPYMSVYYATKAYVLSFSQALDWELRRKGITVTALCPGPTTTDFQRRAGVENSPLFRNNTMTPQAVAELGYEGMQRGRRIVVTGAKNRFLAFAVRFAPRSWATAVAGKLNSAR